MIEAFIAGLALILVLAPLGCLAWLAMLFIAFKLFGIHPKKALYDISLPEAVFFGSYAFASAYLVAALFSRFV